MLAHFNKILFNLLLSLSSSFAVALSLPTWDPLIGIWSSCSMVTLKYYRLRGWLNLVLGGEATSLPPLTRPGTHSGVRDPHTSAGFRYWAWLGPHRPTCFPRIGLLLSLPSLGTESTSPQLQPHWLVHSSVQLFATRHLLINHASLFFLSFFLFFYALFINNNNYTVFLWFLEARWDIRA